MFELSENIKTVSFDVFDTVITRITAHPRAVFLLIQEELKTLGELLPAGLIEDFYAIRIAAERTARKLSYTEDVTIKEIYAVICEEYDLTPECVEHLISLEIYIESKAIKVVPETLELLSELRSTGVRIVFVSDMYLPVDVLEKILRERDVFKDGDGLYVSGHMGLAKRTGSLFKKVLHLENLKPSEIFHLGDNRRSDYSQAIENGISSIHLDRGCLNRFEQLLTSSDTENRAWLQWQLIAGASRLARLRGGETDGHHLRTLHAIGANIAGPILFGFVYWVLQQAVNQGAKKIYFLARDGQILHEIAQKIAPLFNFGIELRYLYASRQAWHLPSMLKITERDIGWITKKAPHLTLKRIALRLQLDLGTLKESFAGYGLDVCDADRCLSDIEIEKLSKVLLSDGQLQTAILNVATACRETLISYLDQEGVFDGQEVYIVDTGWHGSMQASLGKVVSSVDENIKVVGFYFGLLNNVEISEQKQAYLFSSEQPREYRAFARLICHLFEVFTTADHGMTTCYRHEMKGRVAPLFNENLGSYVIDGRLAHLRQGMFDFVDNFIDAKNIYPDLLKGFDFRKKSFNLLNEFFLSPQPKEAEAFGRLEYAADQSEIDFEPLAPVISLKDTLYFIANVRNRERYSVTKWIHGSAMRSSPLVRWLVYLSSRFLLLRDALVDKIKSFNATTTRK